jgi:His-Xaa-Ser system radical SAM maturase HxsC
MIKLKLKVDPIPIDKPLIIRLRTLLVSEGSSRKINEAFLVCRDEVSGHFDYCGFSIRVYTSRLEDLDGDVVLLMPGQSTMHRLIRSKSVHNTLLVTEQCDQRCIMCSQPPKKYHVDMFGQFLDAIKLAPKNATIGLSGGEPLLHKARLFDFLKSAQHSRPDLSFHILTNGQHFEKDDTEILGNLDLTKILWGIPIYSSQLSVHDKIVVKEGAFNILHKNLAFLGALGALIELRTVVLKSNIPNFEDLADHISTHHPFTNVWAIMQLENIGYARMNWDKEFFDNSLSFEPIATSLDLATARGIRTSLYNFPLCTVPAAYRSYCVHSISDWKQKFLTACDKCTLKSACGGFFEWYPEGAGFKEIYAQ